MRKTLFDNYDSKDCVIRVSIKFGPSVIKIMNLILWYFISPMSLVKLVTYTGSKCLFMWVKNASSSRNYSSFVARYDRSRWHLNTTLERLGLFLSIYLFLCQKLDCLILFLLSFSFCFKILNFETYIYIFFTESKKKRNIFSFLKKTGFLKYDFKNNLTK